ncbi:MAG: MFS transporter [Chromatiales bacterium]|nr:MFS transporter [Chromatiales bacterium]
MSTEVPPPGSRLAFAVLFASLLCVGLGHSLVYSILPALARELGLAEIQVGGIFTVSAALWVWASPAWGRASDRIGRRPVLLIGLLGYAASTVAFARSIEAALDGLLPLGLAYLAMVASRSVFGLIGAGIFPASQAYVVERTPPARRLTDLARLSAAMGVGTVMGPGLGAALVGFGLLTPLYVVAGLALVGALAIALALPESAAAASGRPRPKLRWLDPRIRPFVLVGLALSTVQAILLQTIGFHVIDRLRLDALAGTRQAGSALVAFAAASLVTQVGIIPRLALSAAQMLRLGCVIIAAATAALVLAGDAIAIVAAMCVAGVGTGLVRPANATAGSLAVEPHEQGAVAGVLGAVMAAGFVLAPLIGPGLYQLWRPGPFLLASGLFAVTAIGLSRRADRVPGGGA